MPASTPRFDAVSAALRSVAWGPFHKKLLAFAFSRCKDKGMAADLAQEAIRRLLEPTTTWDPTAEPDPMRFAMSVVNRLLSNERTSARARRDVPLDASGPGEEPDDSLHPADPRALTEDSASTSDLFARRLTLLRARLARDPLALELLDLTMRGHDAPGDLSAATGRAYETIVAARRRLHHHAAAIARELPEEEPPSRPSGLGEDDDVDADASESQEVA